MNTYKSSTSNKNLLKAIAVAIVATGLSACATSKNVSQTHQRANSEIIDRYQNMQRPRMQSDSFTVDESFYAARTPLSKTSLQNAVRLPSEFYADASFSSLSPIGLTELTSHVSRVSGYRVSLAPELSGEQGMMLRDISYKGNLTGLLDHAAARMNISWRWSGDRIELFRYETRMFRINALAGSSDTENTLDTTSSSSLASGGAGGGGQSGNTGSSGQRHSIGANFDLWEDVTNSIRGILSANGTLTVASSAGIITVNDTPDVLAKVDSQIKEFNAIYGRQIQMHVEVYSVERSASESYATSWNFAWEQAARGYGINFTAPSGSGVSSPTSFSSGITSGPFDGTSVIFEALNSIGKTNLLTSGTVSSLNGQSVPLNVSTEQAYLQSYSTTITGGFDGGGSSATLTPGVVTDGFSMHITPRVLDDNRVLLRYSIDLASVDAIDEFSTDDRSAIIQLPRRSVRNFIQNVSMRNGQTLVLTGFQQSSGTSGRQGPFSSNAWLMGGNRVSEEAQSTIVIVITPIVVD